MKISAGDLCLVGTASEFEDHKLLGRFVIFLSYEYENNDNIPSDDTFIGRVLTEEGPMWMITDRLIF